MLKYTSLFLFVFIFITKNTTAQSTLDSIQFNKEFTSLSEALKNPENVYRLNLSNQKLEFSDTIWSKFTNLKYLSLKNDHLENIPAEIGDLKNMEILDLSGNDFKVLPSTFTNLTSLQELFLNDDKNLQLEKTSLC